MAKARSTASRTGRRVHQCSRCTLLLSPEPPPRRGPATVTTAPAHAGAPAEAVAILIHRLTMRRRKTMLGRDRRGSQTQEPPHKLINTSAAETNRARPPHRAIVRQSDLYPWGAGSKPSSQQPTH
jgi:hypothetical protein